MTDISLWGHLVPARGLTDLEADYLRSLPKALPTVDWVWQEMDRVWHELGLVNSRPLAGQPIGEFYKHPVWLMNGVFTARDPISVSHRDAIARHIGQVGSMSVADYGGGFGELARAITRTVTNANVTVCEPYPTNVSVRQLQAESRIKLVSTLSAGSYDAIVAQDVLEHVEEPIELAYEIASAVRKGGIVIFANCFWPVVQCHLPSTFHLRHTFPTVMRALGLRRAGRVKGALHAQVFERTGDLHCRRAGRAQRLSRVIETGLNPVAAAIARLRRVVAR